MVLRAIIENINLMFPYKTKDKSNKIFVVVNGKQKELRRKIKGLDVIFAAKSKKNIIILHMPLRFKDTTIKVKGVNGKIVIESSKDAINQAHILIDDYSEIYIGKNSRITMPNLKLKVNNACKDHSVKLIIGENVQIGEDVIIRTSDGHSIFKLGEDKPFNAPRDVIIGDNVWLGERVVVLKGSNIPSNTIVGSCALINKKFTEENTIIAGVPAKVVKRDVYWKRANYAKLIQDKSKTLAKTDNLKNVIKQAIIKKIKYRIKKSLFLH